MTDLDQNYSNFVETIKTKIHQAQYEALKQVNRQLIDLYWDIGKSIVDKQAKYNWGKSIVEQLSADLQTEFPLAKGFSTANLWRMRNFYKEYYNHPKLAPMVREISWTKNIVIMEKCKNHAYRYFYMIMTKKYSWSKSLLIKKIKNKESISSFAKTKIEP